MDKRCLSCKYWDGDEEADYGECRRYPPVIVTDQPNGYADVGEEPEDYIGEFPCSWRDEWCGEYIEKEIK